MVNLCLKTSKKRAKYTEKWIDLLIDVARTIFAWEKRIYALAKSGKLNENGQAFWAPRAYFPGKNVRKFEKLPFFNPAPHEKNRSHH